MKITINEHDSINDVPCGNVFEWGDCIYFKMDYNSIVRLGKNSVVLTKTNGDFYGAETVKNLGTITEFAGKTPAFQRNMKGKDVPVGTVIKTNGRVCMVMRDWPQRSPYGKRLMPLVMKDEITDSGWTASEAEVEVIGKLTITE